MLKDPRPADWLSVFIKRFIYSQLAVFDGLKTVLGLRLDLSSQLYRLEGEVRWCNSSEKHYVGLLLDENSPDFVNWTRMFQLDF